MALTIYRCQACGEMVMVLEKGTCTQRCCGKEMTELKANTTDGAKEKHVPALEERDGKIYAKVGSVEHPMTEEHSIKFIAAERKDGVEVRYLHPGEKPEAVFAADGVAAVYEYCNLHGLWKAGIQA